jgi:hypothetical protein
MPKTEVQKSWRDFYTPHPAADVFPMMSEDELRELGEDIREHGLKSPIVIWQAVGGDTSPRYVLDGRNRLAAMYLVGLDPVELLRGYDFEFVCATLFDVEGDVPDPAAYVISANIRRRHLTKKEQADLIRDASTDRRRARAQASTRFAEMGSRPQRDRWGKMAHDGIRGNAS